MSCQARHRRHPFALLALVLAVLSFSTSIIKAMDTSKDYYKLLEVPEDVSDRELKKSYRQLALKYHPDKAEDAADVETAKEKFVQVSEAYEVLSDPEKRKEYDDARLFERFTSGTAEAAAGFTQGSSQARSGGSDPSTEEAMASFTKMFEGIFGHGFNDEAFGAPFKQAGGAAGQKPPNKEFRFSGIDGFGQAGPSPSGNGGYYVDPRLKQPTTLYGSESPVKSLSKTKFPGKESNYEWLVQFYAMDPPCAEFRFKYEKIARDLRGKVRAGAVNCRKHASFCRANGVKNPPGFFYIWEGQLSKYEGEMDEYLVYNFAIDKHLERLRRLRESGEIEKLHAGNEGTLCNLGKRAKSKTTSQCIVFVLSSDEIEQREKEMKVAKEVAAKFRHSKGLHIAYVDWKTQQEAVQKLVQTAAGHSDTEHQPRLLVLRTKQGKTRVGMHPLDAEYTTEALSATMERAVGGDLPLKKVRDTVHFR
uniref:DnaJ homolog subfamily C member 16 n=1 Tax=Hyaloperonospora arabidopsidis (strain Emoy2) TaxID=559515 RepID=M4BD87_HYAAE